jgi:ligand-binding SRPBCC domain-containing protein
MKASTMEYKSHFTVDAPLESIWDFHRSSASLRAITPPVVPMTSVEAPDPLTDGSQMAFTLWIGPIPVRWEARIEDSTANGFIDRQISGPFSAWTHKHIFTSMEANRTRVDDQVSYEFRTNLFWRLIGGAMALGLPMLFRYRAFRTKQLIERHHKQNGS